MQTPLPLPFLNLPYPFYHSLLSGIITTSNHAAMLKYVLYNAALGGHLDVLTRSAANACSCAVAG